MDKSTATGKDIAEIRREATDQRAKVKAVLESASRPYKELRARITLAPVSILRIPLEEDPREVRKAER